MNIHQLYAAIERITGRSGNFFGREAFVGTAGMRVAATGVIGFFAASWGGAVADRTGSYSLVLTALAILCVVAALLICRCRAPELHVD